MNILYLSISAGGGHIKVCESINEEVLKRYPSSTSAIIDAFKYINPVLDKLVVGSYLNTVKKTPKIYGKLYKMSEDGGNIHDFGKTVNKLLSYKIMKLIRRSKASAVVCSHPFPIQMILNIRKKKRINIPVVAVMTDYSIHQLWLHKDIDAYVVAHDFIKYELMLRGIPEQKIHPLGIPVAKEFTLAKNRTDVCKSLNIKNTFTILIMGGSLGFGKINEIFKSLLNQKRNLQIIVVAGKNQKLKSQLEEAIYPKSKKVEILGYTKRVADLMTASDIIITKPGGITIAEAIVKNLPIIITSPIPGQEERNAHFLMNTGVAARISEDETINSIIHQVVDNPLRISHMKEIARFLAKPYACPEIVDLLEKLTR